MSEADTGVAREDDVQDERRHEEVKDAIEDPQRSAADLIAPLLHDLARGHGRSRSGQDPDGDPVDGPSEMTAGAAPGASASGLLQTARGPVVAEVGCREPEPGDRRRHEQQRVQPHRPQRIGETGGLNRLTAIIKF